MTNTTLKIFFIIVYNITTNYINIDYNLVYSIA